MAAGNEFSDHVFEKKNYLYLASSKLRTCSLGPEVALDADFGLVRGEVAVERAGQVLWRKAIQTGEAAMCHSLAFARVKPAKVKKYMREFSQPKYGVDVLKVEVPINMRYVEKSKANPDGQVAYVRTSTPLGLGAVAPRYEELVVGPFRDGVAPRVLRSLPFPSPGGRGVEAISELF